MARKKKAATRSDTSAKKRAAKVTKRKTPKKATAGSYKGIEYDSLEELAILQWLFELKNQGLIKSIKRADSYLLSDSITNNYAEQGIRKVTSTPKTQTLLHGHSYTPEFRIVWDYQKAKGKFVWDMFSSTKYESFFIGSFRPDVNLVDYEFVTYVEVKPSFDQNNMERLFKLNQKWMWDKHKIFVNLTKVNELFPKTFTPKEYLTTPTGRVRIMKWKPNSLFAYLNQK